MSTNVSENWIRDLPKDVIIDILTRLPVRSILRFKSVCKSWYALFKNPCFTTKHFLLNQSNPSHHPCFLFTCHRSVSINTSSRNSVTLISNEKSVDVPINIEIPFLSISKPLRISGTCNGLICLSILPLGSIILLWNPATREFKDLPVSPIDRPPAGPIKVVFAFGFDANTNDYKLLRIVYYCYPLNQVEMYSLNSNSWTEINTRVKFLIFESSCTVFLNGKFHWTGIGFGELNGEKVIISFDMADEVFNYIMPPRFSSRGNDYDDDDDEDDADVRFRHHLVVLKGSLAMIGCGGNGQDNKLDVWVMNEYGVTGSWTKNISCRMYSVIDRPLGCGRDSQILLGKNHTELFLYDCSTEEIKNVGSRGAAYWSDVFNHVESLLPIRGGKRVGQTDLDDVVPDLFFVRRFDLVLE